MRYFVSILVLQSSRLGRESWLLCFVCHHGVSCMIVMWLFLTLQRVCQQFVIVVFPDHTHLLSYQLPLKLTALLRVYLINVAYLTVRIGVFISYDDVVLFE